MQLQIIYTLLLCIFVFPTFSMDTTDGARQPANPLHEYVYVSLPQSGCDMRVQRALMERSVLFKELVRNNQNITLTAGIDLELQFSALMPNIENIIKLSNKKTTYGQMVIEMSYSIQSEKEYGRNIVDYAIYFGFIELSKN